MPSQIWADNSHICEAKFSTHVEKGRARLSEISDGNSDISDKNVATTKRVETAVTVPTLNMSPALQGGTETNPKQELTMVTHNRDAGGAVQGFYLEREHPPLVRKAGA